MRHYSITNNVPIFDDATPANQYFTIIDLETGKEIKNVDGFYLEVDNDIDFTSLKLRTPGNNRKYEYQKATPNYPYTTQKRGMQGLYDI